MPPAFSAIASGILFVGEVVGSVSAVVAAANAVFYVAVTALINRAIQSLAPKPPKGLGRSLEANYSATDASAPIVLGEVRVGAMETIPPITTGLDGRYLHRVHSIAAHPCESCEKVYFDDLQVDDSAFGSVTGTDNDGLAGSGAGKYANHVWLRMYLGSDSQTVDHILNDVSNTAFSSSFRGRGITYAAIRYLWDSEIFTALPLQTYVMRGIIAYDPRLDATPGDDPTNSSYQAWTQNSALLLAWYLMDPVLGGGYQADEIDWATVVTAANVCDETVSIPTSTTAPRYTCNGLLLASADFIENVKLIVDSMLGRIIFRDGKWRMYAGSWQTPTFDISKTDWISPLSITFEGGREKRFARARCWYVDKSRNWQRVECAPRFNSTYYAADGNEWNDTEFEQPLCNNEYEAQRKTEMLLRQSRNQVIIAGKLPPRFQDIALWDTGAISDPDLGWVDKTFRCVGMNVNPDGSVDAVFQEEQESDWDDLEEADYNAESSVALPSINPTTPSEPASLDVKATTILGTLTFTIGKPVVTPIGTRYRLIRSSVSTNAAVGTVVYDGDVLAGTVNSPSSAHYYFAQAYVGTYVSPYFPNTTGVEAGPRRFTISQIETSSASLFDRQIVNVSTLTADANLFLDLSATVTGHASLDKDSGTFFGLICVPSSLIDTSLGFPSADPTSSNAAGGYEGGFGWFAGGSGTVQSVSLRGLYALNSGTAYTYGVQGRKAFGSLVFTDVNLSARVDRP